MTGRRPSSPRSGRPRRSTCTSASARRARTACTRWSPSTRPSGCTTTSPPATPRPGGWGSPSRTTWRTTASRSAATTSSTAPPTCWPRTTASSGAATCTSTSRSRSPAAWRAGRPTPPPRWSRWTGSGRVNTSDEDLLAIAAELGSDVPFALVGGTALGTGRGEIVDPVTDENTWWWVLRLSPVGPVDAGGVPALRPDVPRRPADPAARRRAARRAGRPGPAGARRLAAQRPAGAGLRPAPRPGEADRLRRGRGRAARPGLRLRADLRLPLRVGRPRPGRRRRARRVDRRRRAPVVLVANGPVAGAHVVEYTQLEDHR